MIFRELTLGNFKNRNNTLDLLIRVPKCTEAHYEEVFHLVKTKKLHAKAIGWVDANLIDSGFLSKSDLYTLDRKLLSAFRK